MNTAPQEGAEILQKISDYITNNPIDEISKIIIAVPFTHLFLSDKFTHENFYIAAQNCSQFNNGAYTGEISAKILADMNIGYCIIGHSERRQYFGDTNEIINLKLKRCYENNICPILCCGEKLEDRNAGTHFFVVEQQLIEALAGVNRTEILTTIIAYEPVWAIGTGETATPQQANEMHDYIGKIITKLFSSEVALETEILYGGSVNATNSPDLFAMQNIHGALVGGASLKATDFCEIIDNLKKI
jgi:triosephosphate isomerase